ncbi:MAG: LCP family protein [Lachnospiraceae bacterium]|jgi:LCP family protein required for cell wall assembly
MAELSDEEKKILKQADEIRDRQMAEKLEAGEITLEEAERMSRLERAENAAVSGKPDGRNGSSARSGTRRRMTPAEERRRRRNAETGDRPNARNSAGPQAVRSRQLRQHGSAADRRDEEDDPSAWRRPAADKTLPEIQVPGQDRETGKEGAQEEASAAGPASAAQDASFQAADSGLSAAAASASAAGGVPGRESESENVKSSAPENGPEGRDPAGAADVRPEDNSVASAAAGAARKSAQPNPGEGAGRRPEGRPHGAGADEAPDRENRFDGYRLTRRERKDLEKYEKERRKRLRREEEAYRRAEKKRSRRQAENSPGYPERQPGRGEQRRADPERYRAAAPVPAAAGREIRRPEPGIAEDSRGTKHRKDKKKSFGRKLRNILLAIILVFVLLLCAVLIYMRVAVTATNYSAYDPAETRSEGVYSEAGVTNVLLIGTDSRTSDDASRSDAMILLSINNKKNKVVMTSILRDSYVSIPGYGQNRLNHAYQMGGAPLLITTIENNFGVAVDYYVTVDFYSFIDVVDAFGGVYLTITDEELPYVNGYVSELNHIEGLPEGTSFLDQSGYQLCDGRQALGYSRIRYIGTDFARTERQRTVLKALLERVKQCPWKIFEAMNRVFPDLTTNIGDNRMELLFLQFIPPALAGRISQFRVPADGCWSNAYTESGQEVLEIDFEQNNALLKSAIYD